MADSTPSTSQRWDGSRREPDPTGSEIELLRGFLDWHRETLALKCSGVPSDQLSARLIEPSGLTLHGLVRHLAAVERWWFRIQFAQEDVPLLHYSDDDPDQDFDDLEGDFAEAVEVWRAECAKSREIVAAADSLDQTGIRRSTGEPISLRFVMLNLIAEYARHNGHADLLRERIDGRVGM
ncbi:DinB family protein [Saccharopolyspora sp. WRP15-2]|uniref:DinB family protein n=1 Tax=Saccharopolyspora oryzae TaxID=2997343 RepID=A0ABT4V6T2_9PSEU|nr:DinB family protein [Saccharopolyspora oryzae]MDA3629665.1 DinB family protein [Saccharopolyspora oryzae]